MFLQTYAPLGSDLVSALLALLPLVFLCLLLVTGWLKPTLTYGLTLLLTAGLAGLVWKMPVGMIGSTVFYGVLFALFPLFYMIWSSLFLFKVAEACGYIEAIQNAFRTVVQGTEWKVLLVGYGLTAFIDSTAGFLAPVAIVTALLVQLGVSKEKSAMAALTSSAVPAVFGAVGVPLLLLSQITGNSLTEIVRQCAFYDLLPACFAPLVACLATCGFKAMRSFWLPSLLGGLSYAAATLLSVLYVSPFLGAVIGAVVYIVVMLLLLKRHRAYSGVWSWRKLAQGWRPFLLLTFCVAVWSIPSVQNLLQHLGGNWAIPGLDQLVQARDPFGSGTMAALWKGQVFASAGTAILLASWLTAVLSKMGMRAWWRLLVRSLVSMRQVAYNLSMICAVGFLLVYSGMAGTLAYPLHAVALGYLVLAPLMGWLGTFLTGSNSASIGLFGGLQMYATQMTHLSSAAIIASFAVAAVGGKMVAPQALEVAVQSAGLAVGAESKLLRRVLGISFVVPLLAIVMAFLWKLFGNP